MSNIVAWKIYNIKYNTLMGQGQTTGGMVQKFPEMTARTLYDVCCVVVLLCIGIARCNRHPGLFL